MILHLTPQSHFSRKVRIVLLELNVECELAYVPDLLSDDPADFAGNPILRVPVLEDGPHWVIESDAIVRHLLETHDPGHDRLGFFAMTSDQRCALAVVSAVMGAEVELLLSRRSGLGAQHDGTYFRRYRVVIAGGLSWLESHAPRIWPAQEFSYLDVALTCMWEHLRYNGFAEGLPPFPWIEERTRRFATRPSVAITSPWAVEELQWQLYPSQRRT